MVLLIKAAPSASIKADATIAIIMPSYNSVSYITQSIEGILSQNYHDWTLYVVDDGSTDDSFDRIAAYAAIDSRIHVRRLNRNSGAVASRNIALGLISSRYIAFCDSDDIWMPDKLEKQLQAIQGSGHGICCTAYSRIDEQGREFGGVIKPPAVTDYSRLLRSNCIGMSTALVDTHICGEIRLPNIARRQDYALWLQLARKGYTALGLQEPLVQYRVHSGSLSSNKMKAAYYHWKVLRDLEKIPLHKALKCFSQYCLDATRKRL